jgi:hypothetical protein
MGYKNRPDNGAEITTFEGLREFAFLDRKMEGDVWSVCKHNTFWKKEKRTKFGENWKDFFETTPMQCWCERKPREVPSLCAEYGGDCLCNGLVY